MPWRMRVHVSHPRSRFSPSFVTLEMRNVVASSLSRGCPQPSQGVESRGAVCILSGGGTPGITVICLNGTRRSFRFELQERRPFGPVAMADSGISECGVSTMQIPSSSANSLPAYLCHSAIPNVQGYPQCHELQLIGNRRTGVYNKCTT